ncbi:MAG: sulfur oxidation c-type cytochrome SoxA, partial [Methyloprofundus sp.]|nr:sulfur oxidation c-type cytochrome SoxA [Methyloprofundus sp.]
MAICGLFVWLLSFASFAWADPVKDSQDIRHFYQQLFPQLQLADYAEGVYAIDSDAKSSWLAIEEFPP